jgi:hypothetical protein
MTRQGHLAHLFWIEKSAGILEDDSPTRYSIGKKRNYATRRNVEVGQNGQPHEE